MPTIVCATLFGNLRSRRRAALLYSTLNPPDMATWFHRRDPRVAPCGWRHARETVRVRYEQVLAAPGVDVIVRKSRPLSSLSKPFGHLPIEVSTLLSSSGAGDPSPAPGTTPS